MSIMGTQAQTLEPSRRPVLEVPGNGVRADYFDSVAEDANALASRFNSRDQWVFLVYDKATGKFHVRSNQSGSGIRALLKLYLKTRGRGDLE